MILDTTFLIDLLKNNSGAVNFIKDSKEKFYTTEITVFELFKGVYQLKDSNQIKKEEILLREFLDTLIIFPLSHAASIESGRIAGMLRKKGLVISNIDCLIAGIALTNNQNTIVTLNKKHFDRIPLIKVKTY